MKECINGINKNLFHTFVMRKLLLIGRKFVLSRNKVYFCKKETITASSGYSFILRKRMFSINTEQVIS